SSRTAFGSRRNPFRTKTNHQYVARLHRPRLRPEQYTRRTQVHTLPRPWRHKCNRLQGIDTRRSNIRDYLASWNKALGRSERDRRSLGSHGLQVKVKTSADYIRTRP